MPRHEQSRAEQKREKREEKEGIFIFVALLYCISNQYIKIPMFWPCGAWISFVDTLALVYTQTTGQC